MRRMYSKKQIEKMADEAGTKLYKHHLVIVWNGVSGNMTFTSDNYLISARSTAYTSLKDLFEDGLTMVSSSKTEPYEVQLFINAKLFEDDKMRGISYNASTGVGSLEHDTIDDFDITDTITTL